MSKTERRMKLRTWLRALTNPHLLTAVAAAWFLTNGWAYCALGIGAYCSIDWLRNLGAVYLGLLWLPGTPEKLLTFALAILLLRLWFPNDTRTLAVLRHGRKELAEKVRGQYVKIRTRLRRKKSDKS